MEITKDLWQIYQKLNTIANDNEKNSEVFGHEIVLWWVCL